MEASSWRELRCPNHKIAIAERPKTHPKSQNTKKHRVHAGFLKSSRELCLLPCDASQEPGGNCSEKRVSMSFFILGGFFQMACPPLNFIRGERTWAIAI